MFTRFYGFTRSSHGLNRTAILKWCDGSMTSSRGAEWILMFACFYNSTTSSHGINRMLICTWCDGSTTSTRGNDRMLFLICSCGYTTTSRGINRMWIFRCCDGSTISPRGINCFYCSFFSFSILWHRLAELIKILLLFFDIVWRC